MPISWSSLFSPSAAVPAAEPLNPTLGFPGRPARPRRPGIRTCWGRAGPASLRGRSDSGPGPGRAGPDRSLLTLRARGFPGVSTVDLGAAAGHPDLGMLGSTRTVLTLLGHSLCAVPVGVVFVVVPLREPLDPGWRTGRRLWGSDPPFAPSSVLARTWSGV